MSADDSTAITTAFGRDTRVWLAAAVYVAVFTALSIYRFSLMGDCYDISIFEQSFWSTVNEGLPLYNSQEGAQFGRFSHFSAHFSPFLFLLTPLYWLWQRPEMLLFIKTAALALAAFPLYGLATALLGSREAGGWVVLSYLLYPPLHGVNLWGFHENEFAVAPLMFLLLSFVRRDRFLFWISLLAALSVKESVALPTAAFGLYLLLFGREKRMGLAVIGVSVTWLFAVQWIIIPFAQGKGLFEMSNRLFRVLYDPIVGQSYGEIFWNIIRHPVRTAHYALAVPERREYLLQLFLPLVFVPLAAPESLLIAAPSLLQNLLSRYRGQFAILGQYHAEMIPFLFYGFCLGSARIQRFLRYGSAAAGRTSSEPGASTQKEQRPKIATGILGLALIAVLVANAISGVWSFAVGRSDFLFAIAKPAERRQAALKLIASIPQDASVLTDVSMIPHLGRRVWLHAINREPFFARDWDYVLLDFQFPWVADVSRDEVIRTLQAKRYQTTLIEDIALFKRPGAPERRKN